MVFIGGPGTGKTQLATDAIRRHSKRVRFTSRPASWSMRWNWKRPPASNADCPPADVRGPLLDELDYLPAHQHGDHPSTDSLQSTKKQGGPNFSESCGSVLSASQQAIAPSAWTVACAFSSAASQRRSRLVFRRATRLLLSKRPVACSPRSLGPRTRRYAFYGASDALQHSLPWRTCAHFTSLVDTMRAELASWCKMASPGTYVYY